MTDRRYKYDIKKHTDGGTYTWTEGEQFQIGHKAFRNYLFNYAKRNKIYVKTLVEWFPNTVTFRFFTTLSALERSAPLVSQTTSTAFHPCVVCGAALTGESDGEDMRCIERIDGMRVEKHPEFHTQEQTDHLAKHTESETE